MKGWLHHRSFQTRISSLVVAAVGVAVALAAVASYFAVSRQLHGQVDTSLSNNISTFQAPNGNGPYVWSVRAAGLAVEGGTLAQEIGPAGVLISDRQMSGLPNVLQLPPTAAQLAMVRRPAGEAMYSTVTVGGTDYRVLTVSSGQVTVSTPSNPGGTETLGALQVAQSLAPVESTLATLRLILLTVMIGGLAIAVILGLAVARATLRPVKRLTAAAEHVAATQQLDAIVVGEADDELGRLATAFNRMLGALGASRHQQAQLVSDAGHELRTPLTSLRTNVELLTRAKTLPADDRAELMADITAQVGELTTLVGDLVELARQDERQPEPTEVRLDLILERAADRARRRAPSLTLDVSCDAGSIRAQPALLERAVLNVLDNATKWSPPDGTVTVRLRRTDRWVLEVRDHGPGIAEEDLPKIFDRFYRAPSARAMPGSGLGLAIVNQVITSHGGTVTAHRPDDGGTLIHIELPIVTEQEPVAVPPPAEAATNGDHPTHTTPPPAASTAATGAPAAGDTAGAPPPPVWGPPAPPSVNGVEEPSSART